ncbi:MAG: hypothetical protein Q4F06_02830 [Eubacteriales bacterium]|nr:hypothetical protein [Eubacteriales bacterium]
MRKKFICIAMVIVCIANTLIGCGADYSSEELVTQDVQNKFPEFSFNSDEQPYYQKDNHIIAVAEKGYYFVRNFPSGYLDNFTNTKYFRLEEDRNILSADSKSYGKMIYFYDINTDTVTPLCSKVDCKHNTTSCQAYFDTVEGDEDGGGFVYYNHRLYMVSYDNKAGMKLVSYDEHGSNQKDECVINSNPEYIPYFGGNNDVCIFNGYVFSCGKRNKSSRDPINSEIVLFRTKMTDKTTEILLTLEETTEQFKYTKNFNCDIEVADNKMYIKTCSYNVEQDIFTYVLYESEGENLKEILRTNAPRDCNNRAEGEIYASIKGFAIDNNRNLYYVDEVESQGLFLKAELWKYDLDTKTKNKIYDLTNTIGYSVMCDDKYIYLNQYKGNSDISRLVIIDKDGNEVYVKQYSDKCDLAGVDDRYVIIRTSCKSNFSFNEETKSSPTDTYKYAALKKTSIGTGNEEWLQIYNGMFIQ